MKKIFQTEYKKRGIWIIISLFFLSLVFQLHAVTADNSQKTPGKNLEIVNSISDKSFNGVLIFRGEGQYPHDQEWNIPDGIHGGDGWMEITLFAYDETVDPVLKLDKKFDNLHGNYEYEVVDYTVSHIGISSRYSSRFSYYLEIAYYKEPIPIKSEPELSQKQLGNDKNPEIEIENPFDVMARIDLDLWFQNENFEVAPLSKEKDIEISIYDEYNNLRKTSVRDTRYSKFVRLDACQPHEKFRILISNVILNIVLEDESFRYYEIPTKAKGRGILVCNVLRYDNEIHKKTYIHGRLELDHEVFSNSYTRTILDPPPRDTHEIPIQKQGDLKYDQITDTEKFQINSKDGRLVSDWSMKSKVIVEQLSSSLDYDFLVKLQPAEKAIIPPTGSKYYTNGEKIDNKEHLLTWFGDYISWYQFYPNDENSRLITVEWHGDSYIDLGAYYEEGEKWKFYRGNLLVSDENNQSVNRGNLGNMNKKSLSVFLEGGKKYLIFVSLMSSNPCKYKIREKVFDSFGFSVIESQKLLSGNEKLYKLEPESKKSYLLNFYQKSPAKSAVKLEVCKDTTNWEPINPDKLYNRFEIEYKPNMLIKLTNQSKNEVEYLLRLTDINDDSKRVFSDDNAKSKNDEIWNAEQIIDLDENRTCRVKGSLSSQKDIDYWKINIDEKIIDNLDEQKSLNVVYDKENIDLSIFPNGQEESGKFLLKKGVYTYYIRIQLKPDKKSFEYNIKFNFGNPNASKQYEFESIEEKG